MNRAVINYIPLYLPLTDRYLGAFMLAIMKSIYDYHYAALLLIA